MSTRSSVLGGIALFAIASGVAAQPRAGRYEDLVALFEEWREFQRPRVRDGVPDYTASAMAGQKRKLPELQGRLRKIDPSGWPVPRQVDWHLVRAEMNGLDFDHRVLRPWQRSPAFYSVIVAEQSDTPSKEGPVFAGALELWRHTFPLPASERAAFRTKLRAIPAILEQARGNLTGGVRDLWLVGIRAQKDQSAALGELAKMLSADAELAADAERARQAVEAFRSWLESKLSEKSERAGVGVADYDWYLKNVHLVPLTWREEVTLHERELARATANLALEEARTKDAPPLRTLDTKDEWDRALKSAASDLMRFLRERDVLTVKEWMEPALLARVTPYAPPERRDFFHQVEAREPFLLRCHGHHWIDLARMEKEPHASPIRRGPLLYNIWDSRSEGLATAMEEMMASAGLLDGKPHGKELVYAMVGQRAARGLAGLKVHAGELTLEKAIRFAAERTPHGWMKPDGDLVWGEQSLYLEQPGYGTCYLTGKALIEELLAERARQQGASFRLRAFLDELAGAGMIPVSMIRWEMTGNRPEVARASD